jgi:hypothetical protein
MSGPIEQVYSERMKEAYANQIAIPLFFNPNEICYP